MSRYLLNFDTQTMECRRFDAVIVGGGLAGLYCALRLPRRMKIAVLCKADIRECDSWLAQGGIAASIDGDDRALHVRDTMNAGCGINDPQAVRILIDESEEAVRSLIGLGVPFDRGPDGRFLRSLEGNHSVKRILHVNGDATGQGILAPLIADCAERENISLLEDTFAVDLVTEGDACVGVIAEKAGRISFLAAPSVVMATGGIGQLFPTTTNSVVLTGDGVAMAVRAGAELAGLEFIQFHPTALYTASTPERVFLISEAVRGEGALLRNQAGERFMPLYDKRLELAPRDIVARAIYDQMTRTGSPCVYLDITAKSRAFLEKRFPMIFRECREHGIDMAKDWIPVAPCEHYFMGGIRTDLCGRTDLNGLYAVGECASTGVHGANRLASNSLLENVVFGARTAAAVAGQTARPAETGRHRFFAKRGPALPDAEELRARLRKIMRSDAGIIRSESGLRRALRQIEEIQRSVIAPASLVTRQDCEVADMYQTAGRILLAAAEDRRSIGSHYIADSPVSHGGALT